MGVLGIFQGSPYFGPWIPLEIIYFEVLGDILGSGRVWDEGGACLVQNDGGVVVDWKLAKGSPWFRPWLLLGLVKFWVLGMFQGLRLILGQGGTGDILRRLGETGLEGRGFGEGP